MKERFTTVDLLAVVEYFNRRLLGMRAANIYDIDHKTYLIKLARSEEKIILLFESGCRIHTTEFDWPKNMMPSGFAMKLRKHLRTKRLVSVTQLGVDRVVDLQFGSSEHAHHLIIELYDRGNVILTDHAYTILNLLRVRTDTDTDVKFAIRETFSMETIKMDQPMPTKDQVLSILSTTKPGDQLKHVLNPHFVFGPALLSHCIIGAGLPENAKINSQINPQNVSDVDLVLGILSEAFSLFQTLRCQPCKGYLIQKRETAPVMRVVNGEAPPVDGAVEGGGGGGGKKELVTNVEFHPMLFRQHCSGGSYQELETFNKAVDEFFSSKTSQKQDVKTHQMEKAALKKLENIHQDHHRRLQALKHSQDEDAYKAHLIELNTDLVEKACLVIRSAVASSMDWRDIDLLVREAQSRGDPVASAINNLKLQSNQITLLLKQFVDSDDDEEEENEQVQGKKKSKKGVKVDIDLSLSAYANAQKYYSQRKTAARKEQRTIDASKKALKSAEKKAKQSLKEAAVVSRIQKARKVLWFEKFYWFISSENYLVIGGRDQQQNELIVKKYLNDSDLYVHADLHGATSVIVKNSAAGGPVPPKTLNEAGMMAVCYSSAWEAKIVTSAWWVYANQVSKTAPTGEYLTTGSFMIRGKKNFLPPCQLTLGFSVMFKLEETCIAHHLNERRVKGIDDDQSSVMSEVMSELAVDEEEEEEIREEGPNEVEELNDQPLEDKECGPEQSSNNSDGEEEEDDGEYGFLDTEIQIQQSRGGIKLEFQRSTSNTSSISDTGSSHHLSRIKGVGKDESDGEDQDAAKSVHRHLSAKERRMQKKKTRGTEELPGTMESGRGSDLVKESKGEKKNAEKLAAVQNQYKRGQKSKQKKIKDKYWDQDDEEREMRMEILASSGAPKELKGKKGKAKGKKTGDLGQTFNPKAKYHQKSREKNQPVFAGKQHKQQGPMFVKIEETAEEDQEEEEEEKKKEELEQEIQTVTEDMKLLVQDVEAEEKEEPTDEPGLREEDVLPIPLPSYNADVGDPLVLHPLYNQTDTVDSVNPELPDSKRQPLLPTLLLPADDSTHDQTTSVKHVPENGGSKSLEPTDNHDEESDEEEKQAILAEENILQLEESEKNSLVINTLTGSPLPNDLLLFAVPVCAPYSALLEYKFKVKLVPGTNRRGKAAKTAVYKFIQMKETVQLEKDLLRSIKDNDLSRYFPGKVKMTIPQQILRTKRK